MTNEELINKIRNEILHLKMKELQRTNGINTGADVYLSSYAVLSILSNALTEESEDERIRKEIVGVIQKHYPNTPESYRWISWLEKQKEQKPAEWSRQSIIDALTKWLTEKITPLHKKSLDGTITEREEMFMAALLEIRSLVNSPDFQIWKETSAEWSNADMKEARNNLISVCRDWERGEQTTLLPIVAVRARYFLEHLT